MKEDPKHVIIVIGGGRTLLLATQPHLPPGSHVVVVDSVINTESSTLPPLPLRDIDLPQPMPTDGDLPKYGTRNGQKAVRQQKARELRRNRQ